MTNELTPVHCGCGGEAFSGEVRFWGRCYTVQCSECGIETKPHPTEAEAVTAWNRAMGERTAKVKKRFMLVTGGMGDTLPLCKCGFIVSDKWTYCPSCGARLEWDE